jgi:hypothetical protein
MEGIMRKRIVQTSAIGIAAAVMAIGSASAARADELLVANVPFSFIVGNMQLPAGKYVVKEMEEGTNALAIASPDGRQFACTLSIHAVADNASRPELVFEKFDQHYFLARIVAGDGDARDVVLTPATMEREIARSADSGQE